MVVIRLARAGAKNKPFFHIVVADSRAPRDGRFKEKLGFYNPVARGESLPLVLDLVKVEAWIKKGARVRNSVKKLIQSAKRSAREREQESVVTTPKETKGKVSTSTGTKTKEMDARVKVAQKGKARTKPKEDVAPRSKKDIKVTTEAKPASNEKDRVKASDVPDVKVDAKAKVKSTTKPKSEVEVAEENAKTATAGKSENTV